MTHLCIRSLSVEDTTEKMRDPAKHTDGAITGTVTLETAHDACVIACADSVNQAGEVTVSQWHEKKNLELNQ